MDYKPEDLYPIHGVPVPPLQHQMGKVILASVLGLVATSVASKAYDFGLGTYRHFRSK